MKNSYLIALLLVVGWTAASSVSAAESTAVVIQWNSEVGGSPVETLLSADGRFLMAMFAQGTIARWNLATGKRLPSESFTHDHAALKGRSSELWFKNCRVLSPAFSISGTSKLAPRAIAIVDPATGKLKSVPFEFDKAMLFANTAGALPADVSADGKRYAITADTVYLVNAATGKTLHKLTAETRDAAEKPAATLPSARTAESATVCGLAFSRHAKHLAAVDKDGTITVWDTASGKVHAVLDGPPIVGRSPIELMWFDDNTLLVPSSITDGKLARWDIETKRAIELTWSRPTAPAALPKRKKGSGGPAKRPSPDAGRTIAGWDGQTRQFGGAIAFSPDATRVVYAIRENRNERQGNDQSLAIVDIPAGRVIGEIPLHPDHVFALEFSRDSKMLIMGSRWDWYTVFRYVPFEEVEALARAGQPLSRFDQGLAENPEVASWSRFQPGDYVQHDVTVTHNLRTVTGNVTHNLRERFADGSGVTVAASTGHEITNVAGPTIIPLSRVRSVPGRLAVDTPSPTLNMILARFEGKTTPQGKETLNLGGKSYDCDVIKFDGQRYDTDGYAYPVTGKYWSCADVPGLVVKCSSVSKLRTDLRVEMVLKQIVRK